MHYQGRIHESASRENINAYQWYEERQKGLGERYLNAIEKQIVLIVKNPEQYGILRNRFRQVKVKGFPYSIVYEFFPDLDIIHIAAIFHTSRNPRKKFRKAT